MSEKYNTHLYALHINKITRKNDIEMRNLIEKHFEFLFEHRCIGIDDDNIFAAHVEFTNNKFDSDDYFEIIGNLYTYIFDFCQNIATTYSADIIKYRLDLLSNHLTDIFELFDYDYLGNYDLYEYEIRGIYAADVVYNTILEHNDYLAKKGVYIICLFSKYNNYYEKNKLIDEYSKFIIEMDHWDDYNKNRALNLINCSGKFDEYFYDNTFGYDDDDKGFYQHKYKYNIYYNIDKYINYGLPWLIFIHDKKTLNGYLLGSKIFELFDYPKINKISKIIENNNINYDLLNICKPKQILQSKLNKLHITNYENKIVKIKKKILGDHNHNLIKLVNLLIKYDMPYELISIMLFKI